MGPIRILIFFQSSNFDPHVSLRWDPDQVFFIIFDKDLVLKQVYKIRVNNYTYQIRIRYYFLVVWIRIRIAFFVGDAYPVSINLQSELGSTSRKDNVLRPCVQMSWGERSTGPQHARALVVSTVTCVTIRTLHYVVGQAEGSFCVRDLELSVCSS